MAIRTDYKSLEEVSQRGVAPLEITHQKPVLEGGIGEPVTLATDDLAAWKWATLVAHQDAKALWCVDAFRFFYLWNCDLEGV